MKKILLIMILMLILTGCSNEKEIYKMATGGTGGTYYPIGSAIAEMLSDASEDYIVNAYIGNASADNIKKMADGDVDMALVQNNVAYWAFKGLDMFEGNAKEDLRGISTLYSEMIHIIVRDDGMINSMDDLKGKKVNLGDVGSGNYFDALNILTESGIDIDEITILNHNFTESIPRLKDGTIDATFITSGIPTASVVDLATELDIKLIELDPSALEGLIERYPYYSIQEIPSGTYRGVEKTTVLSTKAIWAVNADLNEEVVYEMTRVFWEEYESLRDVHPIAYSISIEDALKSLGIPLHHGAEKYYKEHNIEVDD